ncbi:MAG: hypothetical protein NC341_11695 [Blautia sp.]|nr:hypothetical protein [Blautia sp.]MCM1202119.1 hypothetical protein [Bacteroides fragilis]
MKRDKFAKLCLTACLVCGMAAAPASSLEIQAAEVIATVQGTVASGTTSDLLLLSTQDGEMQIKLDGGTDTSGCKILLPDSKVSVSVSHGSDGYLHAVKLSGDTQAATASLDASTTATVTGTIGSRSKGDVLCFKTPQGEMEIKLDPTTNLSNCSVLVADKSYSIVCVRGSDAYMHAVSISDSSSVSAAGTSGSTGTGYTGVTPAPVSPVGESTSTVSGTVTGDTKENLLYLSTTYGVMQIAIDNNTDSRNGIVLTPGNKLTVSVYRGSDAYMHAATIMASKDGSTASVDTSSTSTVTGTVGSKSNENLLYLSTQYGEMELKLDSLNSVNNLKVLVSGRKVTVTCARGNDAYMHAISITG